MVCDPGDPRMTTTKLKHIAVSEQNYASLKALGHTAESFNDVITVLLAKSKTEPAIAQ
jgi:predicted CopG family antitoxin